MSLMLSLFLLHYSHLLCFELLNLLFKLMILRHYDRVSLVTLGRLFLHLEKLADNLIHCVITGLDLWRFVLLDNLPPVHIFKFIANITLADYTF